MGGNEMTKKLIINFPNAETRKDFVGKWDRLFAVEGEDDVHYAELIKQEDNITYEMPDKGQGAMFAGEVFKELWWRDD